MTFDKYEYDQENPPVLQEETVREWERVAVLRDMNNCYEEFVIARDKKHAEVVAIFCLLHGQTADDADFDCDPFDWFKLNAPVIVKSGCAEITGVHVSDLDDIGFLVSKEDALLLAKNLNLRVEHAE